MSRKLRKGCYVQPGRDRGAAMLGHFALAGVLACAAAVATAQAPSQAEADGLHAKLVFIVETGASQRGKDAPPVSTSFTDDEVNAYLTAYGPKFLPDGITHPHVGIGDQGSVTVRGIVDLDAVRRSRERGWLDPMAYLSGSLEVSATGVVVGSNGTGVAHLESATVGGVEVPKRVVQELVRYYTKSPERPNGFDLDEPFGLPMSIDSVLSERGRATIVQ